MASAHIEIVGNETRSAGQLRRFIDSLQNIVDDVDKLKAVYDQAALGADWDGLAVLLGTTAANAEAIYNLIGSVQTELHGTFTGQFLSRLG